MNTDKLERLSTDLSGVTDPSLTQWAVLLIECMKGLITEIKVLNRQTEIIAQLGNANAINTAVTTALKEDNMRLNDLINNLEYRLDDQEQRSRNTCLLLHGYHEVDDENVDDIVLNVINKDLGLTDVNINDIQRSRRS